MEFKAAEIIASLSLLVSCAAVYFARASSKKANKIAEDNFKQTSKIAEDNFKLQQGMVDLEIMQSIEGAKLQVSESSKIMIPYKVKEDNQTISDEDAAVLELYRKSFDASVQTMINYYDAACSKFIDGKVDVERFKKTYTVEIRQLVENQELQRYFHPTTSKYRAILKLYKEWGDLEK
ncbi:hypothetical protein ACOQNQ_19745 [Pseudomonas juntendi]|uniref:hypothetical protein n=1 Tax=Pseudomonas juntendi TaxID=2666183 RepID=UPI001FFCED9C|nr:hypothetical protein [Pseudomonas juntendi]MCK2113422.1 hypothetical protein [Pseudomonas juntendi]MCK2117895.1 hypothetical protein [Pseudomonas juntendi]NPA21339.1 hypothetical protein [Gammaproteobacteria bacterium]